MPDVHHPQPDSNPTPAAQLGSVLNPTESFRNVPHTSEPFRTVRNDSESFRNIPNASERNENHTLTVREVARMFETAGVARTERSIVKWCRRVGNEVPRLDSYFDPNERKYFITPQSVELAIAEEQAKAARVNTPTAPGESIPHDSEQRDSHGGKGPEADSDRVEALEKEVLDLKILNKGKDFFIDRLNAERQSFTEERKEFIAQLVNVNRRMGELETRLQLAGPNKARKLEVRPDASVSEMETTRL